MHQQRLTTHDELVISLSGALTAANQFVALASSFLPPRGGARGPRRRGCHVAAVPPHILVECVGKRWVVAVDRPVLAYLGARSRADFAVFFSVSHTLGLVQLPCFVDPNEHAYGWTAPDTCVVPQDTGSGSATDPNIMSLVVKKLQRAGEGEGEDDYAGDSECVQQSIARFDRKALRAACSRRWIVVSPKDSKRIMVWRVGGDGMARGDPVACPFTGELQKLRFWSTTSEYESESDTLEMSFLLEGPALCVHHVDLNKVWQEGEIRNPAVVFECSLTDELSEELCAPLIDRANLKYYLPFTKVGHKRKKAHRMVSTGKAVEYHSFKAATITSYNQVLLDLSTGNPITWLKNATKKPLEVKAVDESHLATTTSDHASTSIFSLSSLCQADQSRGSFHPRCPVPLCTYRHPPGTQAVTAGCGLLVTSTTVPGTPLTPSKLKGIHCGWHTSSTRRYGLPYNTALSLPMHTFTDAVSGATLFTITMPRGVLPLSIVPVAFRTPEVRSYSLSEWVNSLFG